MMIAHVRSFLIGLAVITCCVASAMMLGSPAAGTADPGQEVSAEAVELAKNPFFKGQLTPEQEHVKQEGERLRAESVERRFPERWKNTVYLGQLTMLWLPKQYIPG